MVFFTCVFFMPTSFAFFTDPPLSLTYLPYSAIHIFCIIYIAFPTLSYYPCQILQIKMIDQKKLRLLTIYYMLFSVYYSLLFVCFLSEDKSIPLRSYLLLLVPYTLINFPHPFSPPWQQSRHSLLLDLLSLLVSQHQKLLSCNLVR